MFVGCVRLCVHVGLSACEYLYMCGDLGVGVWVCGCAGIYGWSDGSTSNFFPRPLIEACDGVFCEGTPGMCSEVWCMLSSLLWWKI